MFSNAKRKQEIIVLKNSKDRLWVTIKLNVIYNILHFCIFLIDIEFKALKQLFKLLEILDTK